MSRASHLELIVLRSRYQDLSLLTHLSASDIDRLQSVGRDAQTARQHFILRDDQDKVWEHISALKNARIDFVLDNGMRPFSTVWTDLLYSSLRLSWV